MNRTVLINGNTGYIGPVLVRYLRATFPATRLIGFDSGFFTGCLLDPRFFPEAALHHQVHGDMREPPADLFAKVDGVVQLAAISNDPMGNAFEKVTEEINTQAVVESARRARDAGARHFVFASSCSVYGAAGDEAKTEQSPLNPLTAYARSKIAAEEALAPLATKDFTITCLRFATACGYSPRLRLDLVLNDFVAAALTSRQITILSDGTPWRPLIEVRDMCRAIDWALHRPASNGGNFLVVNAGANNWNFQVRELAEAVRAELGSVSVTINPNAVPDKRSYRVDFGLYAKLAPQHQPQQTLVSTIRGLAEGLRGVRFADPEFRKSNLIRLKVLSDLRNSGLLTPDLLWAPAGANPLAVSTT